MRAQCWATRRLHPDADPDRSDLRVDHPVKRLLEALRDHASRIEASGDDWLQHQEHVETTLGHLQDEVEADEGALGEVAESVRDGAVELFRGEPSEIVRRADAVLKKVRSHES